MSASESSHSTKPSQNRARLTAHLRRRARWRWTEILFWLAILAAIFAIPSRAALINEILIAGLFALSLDLILGLAGIVSLGHAAFFGLGAYSAAILSTEGIADPTLGLVLSSLIAAVLGLATAPLLLRGADLTRLMVTMGIALMLGELANRNSWITGGADGLEIAMAPLLGLFPIGFTGQRNAALYSFVVLFLLFAFARRLAQSPFGLSLLAIRENRLRAGALGVATSRRIIAIYVLAAGYAGAAGALLAQTTQIVSLDLFDFHRSADVLLMLIIGGAGYLYGGIIGAAIFIVLRDVISSATPEYWEFWIGALLVVLVLVGRERLSDRARLTLERLRRPPAWEGAA
jgi:branched-chain amino acid transport system permease protein